MKIEQRIRKNRGEVIGLRVQEFVVEVGQLSSTDLAYLALVHPARALKRVASAEQIVVRIDALDEIQSHRPDNILASLTDLHQPAPGAASVDSGRIMCPEIPVMRATAGGICSPSGSAINDACVCLMVVPRTWAQPSVRAAGLDPVKALHYE